MCVQLCVTIHYKHKGFFCTEVKGLGDGGGGHFETHKKIDLIDINEKYKIIGTPVSIMQDS